MSEALWAQVISGAFGLATMVAGTYLPARIRRRGNESRKSHHGDDSSSDDRDNSDRDDSGRDGMDEHDDTDKRIGRNRRGARRAASRRAT